MPHASFASGTPSRAVNSALSFSLPLLAAMALLVPLSIPALKQSGVRFSHPVWTTVFSVGLFCAQLAPTLYTGNYLGDGRVLNTYHYTLVMMLAQLVLYWTGYFIRRSERGLAPLAVEAVPAATPTDDLAALPALSDEEGNEALPKALFSEQRLKAVTLLLVAAMLVAGCVAYRPDGAPSYGPQNMAGGSALRSVLSGEAAAFDRAMDERERILNDTTLTDVALQPILQAPASFMGDAVQSDNVDYVLRLYADYYDKATVTIAGNGE